MLEHWGQYITANEERDNFSWRKDWSNSDKRRLSYVKYIVECIQKKILESGHGCIEEFEKMYSPKKSIATFAHIIQPKK